MTDFVNLTRGLLCCQVEHPHFMRVQSTWCEQKRWHDVLAQVGDDFLYHLAAGLPIVVHDVSEKRPMTRACWQGLPWVRFACERIWGAPPGPAIVRGGADASVYFGLQLAELPERTRRLVAHHGKYWAGQPLTYKLCERMGR